MSTCYGPGPVDCPACGARRFLRCEVRRWQATADSWPPRGVSTVRGVPAFGKRKMAVRASNCESKRLPRCVSSLNL